MADRVKKAAIVIILIAVIIAALHYRDSSVKHTTVAMSCNHWSK